MAKQILLLVLAVFLSTWSSSKATDNFDKQDRAKQLVYQALEAEIQGDAALRLRLLNKAIQFAPDYEPARWQLGQIKLGGEWVGCDELNLHARNDARLLEREQLMSRLSGTLEGETRLALWCRKNGLDFYEKYHWIKVVELQPDHTQALRALNLRWYQGQLLGRDVVEKRKELARKAKADFKRWEAKLTEWRSGILSDDPNQRKNGLAELRAITDPCSIEALEKVISYECPGLAGEVIRLLSKMDDLRATDSLIRHAVLCEASAVRVAASNILKERRFHDVVPTLLAEMRTKLKITGELNHVSNEPDYSTVLFRYQVAFEGWQQEFVDSKEYLRTVNTVSAHPVHNTSSYKVYAHNAAVRLEKDVNRVNKSILALNKRITNVLNIVSGENFDSDPKTWWTWWNEYNEYYEREKEIVCDHRRFVSKRTFSCFRAGTMVWTRTGLRPIELLHVGDGVLSQNPETGELAFRPVLEKTVRPPSPTIAIELKDETIYTTLGHPMWVVGEGWKMAKRIKSSDRLHGLDGANEIISLNPSSEVEAYNLVVGEFNTYFVGTSGLLVHDNNHRKRTPAQLPGMNDKP